MAGALQGIRVIDFGQYISGPLAAVMLADQGADVIHIDPPGGPVWARGGPADAFLNRGKRRITLDLHSAEDRQTADRLIASTDVVIENFRPGVMERLGLGHEAMTARDPRLVYCSIPGFGHDDPRAQLPAWEGTIKAATDDARVRAGEEPPGWDFRHPYYSALPIASNIAAILSASSITNALTFRHRAGRGQWIEIPMFDAMFELIGGEAMTARPLNWNGTGTYECKDGRWIQFNASNSQNARFLTWLVNAAGMDDWWNEGVLDYEGVRRSPELLQKLKDLLAGMFKTRTAWEWEELANVAGSCLCVARTTTEWMETKHARQTGAVIRLDDPEFGPTWMAGPPIKLTAAPADPQPRHLPDADRAAILAELDSYQKPAAPAPKEPNIETPLEGVKVIDLCQFLAGPTAGRMIGEFGATVIKIDPVKRGRGRLGLHNRGKKSINLDIQSSEGQKVFWKLVDYVDAIHINFPEGAPERYGIGYSQVRARKPDIVYSSVTCYGNGGPFARWRGFETQGQAMCGMVERLGEPGHSRPGISGPYNILDYGTGAMATFGFAVAMYHKFTTGEGTNVQAALSWTGTFHQATFLFDYAGHEWTEPRGYRVLGLSPLERFYETPQGWFFLGARPDELDRLALVDGLEGIDKLGGDALEQALEQRFRAAGTAREWSARLQAAGFGAHYVEDLPELMQSDIVRERRLSIVQEAEDGSQARMVGNPIRMYGSPIKIGNGTSMMGVDGLEILEAIGMADQAHDLENAWAMQVFDLPQPFRRQAAGVGS